MFSGPTNTLPRQMRARSPRFRPDIDVLNFQRAKEMLGVYGYSGPVSLAWDDTELEPVLSTFVDGETVFVVGGPDGSLAFKSEVDFDAWIEKGGSPVLADKVCIFLHPNSTEQLLIHCNPRSDCICLLSPFIKSRRSP